MSGKIVNIAESIDPESVAGTSVVAVSANDQLRIVNVKTAAGLVCGNHVAILDAQGFNKIELMGAGRRVPTIPNNVCFLGEGEYSWIETFLKNNHEAKKKTLKEFFDYANTLEAFAIFFEDAPLPLKLVEVVFANEHGKAQLKELSAEIARKETICKRWDELKAIVEETVASFEMKVPSKGELYFGNQVASVFSVAVKGGMIDLDFAQLKNTVIEQHDFVLESSASKEELEMMKQRKLAKSQERQAEHSAKIIENVQKMLLLAADMLKSYKNYTNDTCRQKIARLEELKSARFPQVYEKERRLAGQGAHVRRTAKAISTVKHSLFRKHSYTGNAIAILTILSKLFGKRFDDFKVEEVPKYEQNYRAGRLIMEE